MRSDEKLSAAERLEVYANAYFYRIRDCLEEDFPALRSALSEALFHDLVTAYLIAHAPRDPSLRVVGDRLAGFLRDARAAEPFRRRLPWAADLAHFEWTLLDVFVAADADTVSRAALAEVEPERWEELRFDFHPATALLELEWPVHVARRAWDGDSAPLSDSLTRAPTRLCVWRREERVHFRPLDDEEAVALAAARRQEPFGALCEALAEAVGESEAPALAATLLGRWIDDGLISEIGAAEIAFG